LNLRHDSESKEQSRFFVVGGQEQEVEVLVDPLYRSQDLRIVTKQTKRGSKRRAVRPPTYLTGETKGLLMQESVTIRYDLIDDWRAHTHRADVQDRRTSACIHSRYTTQKIFFSWLWKTRFQATIHLSVCFYNHLHGAYVNATADFYYQTGKMALGGRLRKTSKVYGRCSEKNLPSTRHRFFDPSGFPPFYIAAKEKACI